MEDTAITSPDPVDINVIAIIVRIRIPPEFPSNRCAIKGVTRPRYNKHITNADICNVL